MKPGRLDRTTASGTEERNASISIPRLIDVLGATTRRAAFWFSDSVRGGRVKKHLREIQAEFLCNAASAVRERRLSDLLRHAKETTPFYREIKGNTLAEFPVVDKATLRRRLEDFHSSSYRLPELIPMSTSGSTGVPLTFWLSHEKKSRQTAEVIFFSAWAGYQVGDRHAYLRINKTKNALRLYIQNEIAMDPSSMDNKRLGDWEKRLSRQDIKILIGYSSALTALGRYCEQQRSPSRRYSVRGVIASSEPLVANAREMLRKTFDCPVLSRYATQEFGVIAHECPERLMHHVNFPSYVVEVLKIGSDEPAGKGEPGRVVVTDLFSHAMPLIRVDTGDVATLGSACSCGRPGPVLENIQGRLVERVFKTTGEAVSPYAIVNFMWGAKGVAQFQFTQKSALNYELKVVRDGDTQIDIQFLSSNILKIVGDNANIAIIETPEIPSPRTGKRPYVRSEYVPSEESGK